MRVTTDRLDVYYHYKEQEFNANLGNGNQDPIQWGGRPTIQEDGAYFDGVDDGGDFRFNAGSSGTFEACVAFDSLKTANIVFGVITYTNYGAGFNGWLTVNSGLGGGPHLVTTPAVELGVFYHLSLSFTSTSSKFYINGNLVAEGSRIDHPLLRGSVANMEVMKNSTLYTHGKLKYIRFYSKELTDEEVMNNYLAGDEVWEKEPEIEEPTEPPYVTNIHVESYVLSNQEGFNSTIVTFTFDKPIAEYRLNLDGVSYETGRMVTKAEENIPAGVEVIQVVYYSDQLQEGDNRINIYGRNINGDWTPYSAN